MLSPQQFADLISLIETCQDDNPKPEVRRAQRIAHPCRLTITLGDNDNAGLTIGVQLKDISARGACLLHSEELAYDQQFVLMLSGPNGMTVPILSHVVYCRRVDKDVYQVGAEFICILGKEKKSDEVESAESLSRIRDSILF